jgi:hypothetical protein
MMLLDGLTWKLFAALPNVLKWTAVLLVLVNVRSFPFLWHSEHHSFDLRYFIANDNATCLVRMFAPLIKQHIRWHVLLLKLLFRSKKDAEIEKQRWLDSLSPVGLSPFEIIVSHPCWAGMFSFSVCPHVDLSSKRAHRTG